ncbi:lipocalin-like domain-containing protein [Paraclostridium sordellii]|uniref:lipocalin-like domain-containing protein n=1 Tax=Paraclostridium sordellii TaxID=1505 RepID=UPI0005DE5653|nr:lipocalin-like domain-containing protein [Paeniclostridium sordellii]CEO06759.1 Predicted secreted hydrolase [[Clostridium] sordellii] [Paeniclostridium sordellii]CEP86661.1 Predicted secreted hydrolase [[Clostridium] sordellii] [Paeniclostridium sordellii]CEP99624.1 Predicted secreted hydrolase [[Clostridium] sordellii] [Paeniclostridium sordellii]
MAKDIKVRVMDQEKDYIRMGTKKGYIEAWEDGKRDDDRKGVYEWWYFDMILDDGSKAVIHFNTKDNRTIGKEGTIPSVVLKITDPNGKEYKDNVILSKEDATFKKDRCYVKFGPHSIDGDLQTYHIHVDKTGGVNGSDGAGGTGEASNVGADLTLVSTSKPWRPGAGGFTFGDDEKGYFTWLCAVPRGTITGTLFYDGKEHEVTGIGYHDHQWGNMKHVTTWDHWIWGRQDFGDYVVLVFDIGTQKTFGNKRLPMMFLQDKYGNILMEDLKEPKCRFIEEYQEKISGKMYPKIVEYEFKDGNKSMTYTISQIEELEARDGLASLPKIMKPILRMKGLHPSTSRNFATGKMVYRDGVETVEREGEMIYEFVYMGLTVKDQMENF